MLLAMGVERRDTSDHNVALIKETTEKIEENKTQDQNHAQYARYTSGRC